MKENKNAFTGFARRSATFFLAAFLLLLSSTHCYAVTRAELLAGLFARLGYPAAPSPSLPIDVLSSHKYAQQIGSAVKYGLVPDKSFQPDEQVTRHDAVLMALRMMGWGFEVSLYQSLATLPDLGGSGDPTFFLAAEIKPPAPGDLLLDGATPLSDSGRDALVSWVGQCKNFVQWNRVFSYGGTDLVIYRQGIARPGEPNPTTASGNPVGASACEPLYLAALAVTPTAADQHIAFAEPLGRARVTPTEFAVSYGAIGVVNGGFFSEARPLGTMLLNGTHAGKPLAGRSAVGWKNGDAPIFGRGAARIGIRTPNGFVEFTRFNAPPDPNGAALYTANVTGTAAGLALDALEIIVKDGMVVERRESAGSNHRTPAEGVLVTARGNSRRLLEELQPGVAVEIRSDWETSSFQSCTNLIQAGPMLMQNNQFISGTESFKSDVLDKRHPRTIMGTDGTRSFWVVIDGRSALHSRGTTIEETRWVAKSLGLTTAINMDGGGSSQLIWRGMLVNSPSDGKERPLPYAILVTPKGEKLVRKNTVYLNGSAAGTAINDAGEYGEPAQSSGTTSPQEREAVWMDTYDPMRTN